MQMTMETMAPDLEKLQLLSESLPKITDKDRKFAGDLVYRFKKDGYLSAKQWYWVKVLASRIDKEPEPPKNFGSFGAVISMFQHAQQHLKYPKIWLLMKNQMPLVLTVCGPNSRYKGQINMSDNGKYQCGIWYGRIKENGEWFKPEYLAKDVEEAVEDMLTKLATHPARTAAEYALLTGNCCFCHLPLTDERSTKVGYGKTCAAHYNLPWGTY